MSPEPDRLTSHATVIGAGPAGLMAAERLAAGGVAVLVVDRMASPGRKLLMAGVGGLNITHDQPLDALLRHFPQPAMQEAVRAFPPAALRAWCEALGQPLFTGSSRRVFPAAMKASPLLRAWLRRLAASGVQLRLGHRWTGWQDGGPVFAPRLDLPDGATVLACGGASWARLGSDGAWAAALPGCVAPFRPANCGFTTSWSEHLRMRFAGSPLKRIAVSFEGRTVPGEATLTATGIEGGPFYALGAALRDRIAADGHAVALLDLRPDLSAEAVAARLAGPRGSRSLSNTLRRLGLAPAAIALLHELAPTDPAAAIKAAPLRLAGTAPLDRAISTAGGLRWDALDGFMLRGRPGVFAAGEMLDWEAPTGGFLMQGALSSGYAAGEAALAWLRR